MKQLDPRDKERLKYIVGKKFVTTMIYPLSQFESMFGHLWKHGVSDENLTDEERVLRQKWDACRDSILTMGNHQKNNAMCEIDMYDVIWNKYQTYFYVKGNENAE